METIKETKLVAVSRINKMARLDKTPRYYGYVIFAITLIAPVVFSYWFILSS